MKIVTQQQIHTIPKLPQKSDILEFNANIFAELATKLEKPSQKVQRIFQKIMNEHHTKENKPDEESLSQIYHRFIDCRPRNYYEEFYMSLRVQKLAWVLTYSEPDLPRIVDKHQLNNALDLIDTHFRISTLLGVFDALLQVWDSSEADTDKLRAFIKKHLQNYDGPVKLIQELKAKSKYFTLDDGTSILVEDMLHLQKNISDLYSILEIPNFMYSYSYFSVFTTNYISDCTLNTPSDVIAIVEFVKKNNGEEMIRQFLSQLIHKLSVNAKENLRRPVQSYILKNWGDPRNVDMNKRWRSISDEARNIFRRWMMKDDISFFFDTVVRTRSNKNFYRKGFWLQYFGKIDSCRIVMSESTKYLFRHDPAYQNQKYSTASLKDSKRDQHAIIIQMGNHTYITFFPTEQCYIYDNADVPFHLNQAEFSIHELRKIAPVKSYVKLEKLINREIGVDMLIKKDIEKW